MATSSEKLRHPPVGAAGLRDRLRRQDDSRDVEPEHEAPLDRQLRRQQLQPGALDVWLRNELPSWQRMAARLALSRQLGPQQARAQWARSIGAEPHGFPQSATGAVEPGARLDDCRAQATGELITAMQRTPAAHPALLGALVARLPERLRPLVRAKVRPRPELGEPSRAALVQSMVALAPVAERRATTLYRRAVEGGATPDAADRRVLRDALSRKGTGQALPDELKRRFEAQFKVRFDRVRVHTDPVAAEAACAIQARAFTVGEDIFFADGAFAPTTAAGQELVAHELTHVVQAYQGRVSTATDEHAVSGRGDPLEQEAEAVAARAVATTTTTASATVAPETTSTVGAGAATTAVAGEAAALPAAPAVTAATVAHRSPAPAPANGGDAPGASTPASGGAPAPNATATPGNAPTAAPGNAPTAAPGNGPAATDGAAAATPGANAPAAGGAATPANATPADDGAAATANAAGATSSSGPASAADSSAAAQLTSGPASVSPAPSTSPSSASPDAGALPDLSHSPDLAAAAQQIQQSVVAEQDQLRQEGDEQKAQLQARVAANVAAIQAAVGERVQTLVGDLQQRRGQISAALATARTTAESQAAAHKLEVATESARSSAATWKIVNDQRAAALTAAGAEAGLALRTANAQAARARKSAADEALRVGTAAQQKAKAFTSGEDKGTQAGRNAIAQIASETMGQLRDNGNQLAETTLAAGQHMAEGLNDQGRQLESELGDKAGDQQKNIDAAAQATQKGIDQQLQQQLAQLTSIETDMLVKFDELATEAVDALQKTGQQAVAEAQQAGLKATDQIGSVVDEQVQKLGGVGSDAVNKLAQLGSRGKPEAHALQTAVAGIQQQLATARTQAVQGLTTLVTQTGGQLDSAQAAVEAGLDDQVEKIAQKAADAGQSVVEGVAQLQAQADEKTQQLLAGQAQLDGQLEQQLDSDLQQKVDKAQADWSQQRQKYEDDAKAKVDDGVKGHSDTADRAIGKMDESARDAAHDAESIWSAIGHALWNFVKGIIVFIIVLVVVALVIALVVALFELGLGALAILALALEIAGCIMLAYGLVMNFERRWAQLMSIPGAEDMPWYMKALSAVAIGGIALADTFGLGALFEAIGGHDLVTGEKLSAAERWGRLAEAVLTLLTLGLFKAIKGKIDGAVEDGPTPKEGETPEPKPGEKPPAGMSDWLTAKRATLSDPKALEAFDAMFERMKGNSDRMRQAIEKMEADGSLQDKLIEQWNKANPTPPDEATVKQLDEAIDEAQELQKRVEDFKRDYPNMKGKSVTEWTKGINTIIQRLTGMRNNFDLYDKAKVANDQNNLRGFESELEMASRPGNQGGMGRMFKMPNGTEVEVDNVSSDGKTWTEVKNKTPFGTGSKTWTEILEQAESIKAAGENPANFIDGSPPRRVFSFTNQVGTDVAAALRSMGFEVQTPAEVDPSTLGQEPPKTEVPGLVPNQPEHDRDKENTL